MSNRILVVEDDPAREQTIRSWLPTDIRPVLATSAGAAIGTLRLDRGAVYAGIMLDHDLQSRRAGGHDEHLCGQDVVEAIVEYVDRDVPILIHSMNSIGRAAMASRLRKAGFSVEVIPMSALTPVELEEWLADVREAAADRD